MIITTLFALIGCNNETTVSAPVNPQITDSVTQINEVTGEVKIETPKPTRKPRSKKETSK